MLNRVLEPEVMDSEQDALEYDSMDHTEVNQRFVHDFLAIHRGGWQILDVGTGTALIPIELCRREKRALVLAIDAAQHMLERAAVNVAGAGLVGRIHLERRDAKRLPYGDGAFKAVISNSIVHHIPEPAGAWSEMIRLVAPGGTLFVRDLVRPDDEAELKQLVATYAGGATPFQRALFEASLHAALRIDEVQSMLRGLNVPDTATTRTSDRHWTCAYHRPEHDTRIRG